MKTTILLGLLLTLTVSCKHHSNPVTTEENFHTQEAQLEHWKQIKKGLLQQMFV